MNDDLERRLQRFNEGMLSRITPLEEDVREMKTAMFGYWNGIERVPGVLEQTAEQTLLLKASYEEFKKRDAEVVAFRAHVSHLAWGIARPMLILLGLTVIVGFANLISRVGLNGLMHLGQ